MSPNDLLHIKQDIKELLKKVSSLNNRLDLVEDKLPLVSIDQVYPDLDTSKENRSDPCLCGMMQEEYCTCKLW